MSIMATTTTMIATYVRFDDEVEVLPVLVVPVEVVSVEVVPVVTPVPVLEPVDVGLPVTEVDVDDPPPDAGVTE